MLELKVMVWERLRERWRIGNRDAISLWRADDETILTDDDVLICPTGISVRREPPYLRPEHSYSPKPIRRVVSAKEVSARGPCILVGAASVAAPPVVSNVIPGLGPPAAAAPPPTEEEILNEHMDALSKEYSKRVLPDKPGRGGALPYDP